ncbi:MAG: hypothetical protein QM528_02720 [Phycisphaerales bacterium]|nr:hypothetical protein [Phycisphaerales bacterium]
MQNYKKIKDLSLITAGNGLLQNKKNRKKYIKNLADNLFFKYESQFANNNFNAQCEATCTSNCKTKCGSHTCSGTGSE